MAGVQAEYKAIVSRRSADRSSAAEGPPQIRGILTPEQKPKFEDF